MNYSNWNDEGEDSNLFDRKIFYTYLVVVSILSILLAITVCSEQSKKSKIEKNGNYKKK